MDVNWLPQHGRGPDNQVGLDKQVNFSPCSYFDDKGGLF